MDTLNVLRFDFFSSSINLDDQILIDEVVTMEMFIDHLVDVDRKEEMRAIFVIRRDIRWKAEAHRHKCSQFLFFSILRLFS